MSHVADLEMDIKDLDALEKAGKKLGLVFEKDFKNYKWFGESVGDYPLPAGFSEADLGKCDHVLRIPNSPGSYEIGVVKRRDGKPGYQLLWDFWQGGYGLQDKIGKDGGLLKQAYSLEVAKKQMLRKGYRVSEKRDAKGNVLLTFTE
jgi:hypothetical protein